MHRPHDHPTARFRPMSRRTLVDAVMLLALAMAVAGARPAVACDAAAGGSADGPARSFLGFACREPDCAAHKAGFAWADREGLEDASACGGAADPAFEEGCRAFADGSITSEQSGFQWAAENALADDCDCSGGGSRFAAGCEAFVRGFGR